MTGLSQGSTFHQTKSKANAVATQMSVRLGVIWGALFPPSPFANTGKLMTGSVTDRSKDRRRPQTSLDEMNRQIDTAHRFHAESKFNELFRLWDRGEEGEGLKKSSGVV